MAGPKGVPCGASRGSATGAGSGGHDGHAEVSEVMGGTPKVIENSMSSGC